MKVKKAIKLFPNYQVFNVIYDGDLLYQNERNVVIEKYGDYHVSRLYTTNNIDNLYAPFISLTVQGE